MAFTFRQGDRPLSGYTIQRGVGRGGFGEVYYATSDGGKEIALKYLRDNPQVELRGVQHCLNLKSPHLLAIHDVKQNADGDSFVIMEYVSGPSLRDLMNESPQGMGVEKAAYFLREIGRGLAYLHDCGIVHRDLKPGNIFYEDGYVKIGDYGLAKMMSASQHSGQTISVGTVHYMAPEVGSGNYDKTIDVYALGVILYELMLGKVPFAGATMGEVLMKHLTAQPEVDALPAPFPDVIRKALAKDPRDRYQSVGEMVGAVFSVSGVSSGVENMDSLSLTRMAAAVGQRIKTGAAIRVGGTGSSSVTAFNAPPIPPTPPVVVQPDRHGAPAGGATPKKDPFWEDFKERPFGIHDATAPFPQRDRATTGMLGIFLGHLGVHRFYTGHNRIGVFQIIVSLVTGGFGALWGIIEGIQILSGGDFRDAMGRPLLGRQRVPGRRNLAARVIWGILSVSALAGSVALTLGSSIAEPEMERVGWSSHGQDYYVNIYNIMYMCAAGTWALFAFALWKAAHRGGLGFYKASLRPALMCTCAAIAGAAFALQRYVLVGELQIIGLGAVAVAAGVFLFLWFVRGPDAGRSANDVYWGRTWGAVSLAVAILASLGGIKSWQEWRKSDYEFYREKVDEFVSVKMPVLRTYSLEQVSELNEYQVVNQKYNYAPIALLVFGVIAAGCYSEMTYRWKLAELCVERRGIRGEGVTMSSTTAPIAAANQVSAPHVLTYAGAVKRPRIAVGRVVWAVLATLAGAFTLYCLGLVWRSAPYHYPLVFSDGSVYHVDLVYVGFVYGIPAAALCILATWKAAHRRGLGLWRSTVRPALLCTAMAWMGVAVVMLTCFAAGRQQYVCLFAFVTGLSALLTTWHLRGPQAPVAKHDDYWQTAWARVFGSLTAFCVMGALLGGLAWHRAGYRVVDAKPVFVTREITDPWQRKRWPGTVFQARGLFHPAPIFAGTCSILAVGAFNEYRYRRRQARLAREVLLGDG